MAEAGKQYEKRRQYYRRQAEKLTRTANRFSNARLVLFIAGFFLAICFYTDRKYFWGHAVLLFTAVFFVALVLRHQALKTKRDYIEVLAETYDQTLQRLAGKWNAFPDTGEEFKDQSHPYSGDLDLFGANSLFQWLSTAQTFRGREKLSFWLLGRPEDADLISRKQDAVRELGPKLAWRHRFITEAKLEKSSRVSPENIIEWAKSRKPFYLRPLNIFLARVLPMVTILLTVFWVGTDRTPFVFPLFGFLLQTVVLFAGKKRNKALDAVYSCRESIGVYEKMLERFEKRSYQAEYLRDLKEMLRDQDGKAAYAQIRKLSRISERIANRGNAMFMIVNIFLLWDIQCMIALEAWKEKSGRFLGRWLDTIAELECLVSMAGVRFDHPDWVMPVFSTEQQGIRAAGMGHPLLAQPVCNDVVLDEDAGILLITGSNMSGKSTLLRTVGVNLALAYMGAPVCAGSFRCSLLRIYTCMRVSDDLAESISSFYAELLRIKMIVEAAKEDSQAVSANAAPAEQKILFLLDEIFKGTNSEDRHAGARVLIKQLAKAGAIGLVSTHDLELGDLERESGGKIKNHHFREYYENDEICFDYKLRPGVSSTRNAMYLIRLAGIEIDQG